MWVKTVRDPDNHAYDPFIILFTSFIGGYTASKFPKKVLDFFTTPFGQYISYVLILYMFYIDEKHVTIFDILAEAMLYVIVMQVMTAILNKYVT
jgi:hypothetical protein